MVFQLIYRSTATRHLHSHELIALLDRSRDNNLRLGLTGMLLYREGEFMQLLEGDEETVRRRFDIISRDRRHKWVSLVMTGAAAERDFAEWTMGFCDFEAPDHPAAWSSFLETEGALLPRDESTARNLLLAFRRPQVAA
jgi:hypothetical protein